MSRTATLPKWLGGVKDPEKRKKIRDIDEESAACYARLEEVTDTIDRFIEAEQKVETTAAPAIEIHDNDSAIVHANALHDEAARTRVHPIRVLFVDDERSNLVTFAEQFEPYFAVLTAQSGEEALRMLEKHTVHAVVSDQRMPGMTGVQLLAQVKKRYPKILRVILTAYADLNDAMDAVNEAHIRWYLTKPWNEERVVQALRESILEGREADFVG